MNISGLSGINGIAEDGLYTSRLNHNESDNTTSFDDLFQSALNMINETNELTNRAEEEEIKYAMGTSSSIHDLQQAQEKANISLLYTVTVTNKMVEAYKEIMNMQF